MSFGAYLASNPVSSVGSYTGTKRLGREADHSPLSSAEIKNACSYTSIPPYVFMVLCLAKHRIRLRVAWYLVKQRDSFTFTFTLLAPAGGTSAV
jgi:hypothetical protein